MYHLFFEQSGTFKKEFAKLGYYAEDYDILNDFGQTDHIMDLYAEINKAFEGEASIFDSINPETDEIIAFFPCIRFEAQIIMKFNGTSWDMRDWNDEQKLIYSMKLHEELHELYIIISKFALVCLRKGIKCIIENPYHETHYLTRYWPIKAKIVDRDRHATGDYYRKPTQYFFINREPSYNFVFEGVDIKKRKKIDNETKVERSMISSDYANRFIREYILPPNDDDIKKVFNELA